MSEVQRLKQQLAKRLGTKKLEWKAVLGRADGTVSASGQDVYATLYNGAVITLHNDRVPNKPFRKIVVGYDGEDSSLFQVLRLDNVYDARPTPNVGNHKDSHTWYGYDPVEIYGESIMPLLPRVTSGLTVRVYGGYYYANDTKSIMPTTDYDLTAEIPASGAEWVNAEVDENRNVTYQHSASVASKFLLTPANIPQTAANKKLLFSAKMYLGQTEFIQLPGNNDIYDPRFTGEAGVKTFAQLDQRYPLTDIYAIADGDILVWDHYLGAWVNQPNTGHVIEDEGTPLTQREALNFFGAGVSASDDAGNDASVVTVAGYAADTHAAAAETTLADDDEFGFWNSVTTVIGNITWVNIKAVLKTYFDTLYVAIGGGREILSADRTYYVRTDGHDSNDGLTDSSGGAFLTAAKVNAVVASLDKNGYNVNVQFGAGNWNESILLYTGIGDGSVTWKGTLTLVETATSATVSATGGTNGRGTVTKTGQFTGDNHAGKLAYFHTDNVYRVILSNTSNALTLISIAPSSTTQDVSVYDWGTSIDYIEFRKSAVVEFLYFDSGGRTIDRSLRVYPDCFAEIYKCKIDFTGTMQSGNARLEDCYFFTDQVPTGINVVFSVGDNAAIIALRCYFYGKHTSLNAVVQVFRGASALFFGGYIDGSDGAGGKANVGLFVWLGGSVQINGSGAGNMVIANCDLGARAEYNAGCQSAAVTYTGNTTNSSSDATSYLG